MVFQLLPQLKSFLFCFGLEVGAKIIASIHMLVSIGLVVTCAMLAESFRANVGTVEDSDLLYTHSYNIMVGITLSSTVHGLLGTMLLYGVIVKRKLLVQIWVVIMMVLYGLALVYIIVICMMMVVNGMDGPGLEMLIAVVEGVVFFGLVGYCILCVNSFYLILKSSEDMGGPQGDLLRPTCRK